MSRRTVFQWAAALIALAGGGGAFWEWLDHGSAASAEPGFMVALVASLAGTVVYVLVTMLPEVAVLMETHRREVAELEADQKRIYGTGVRDGRSCAECPVWGRAPVEPPAGARRLVPVR